MLIKKLFVSPTNSLVKLKFTQKASGATKKKPRQKIVVPKTNVT
jgi:hypothetical protein